MTPREAVSLAAYVLVWSTVAFLALILLPLWLPLLVVWFRWLDAHDVLDISPDYGAE